MTMGIQKDLEERNLLRNSIRDLISSKKKEKVVTTAGGYRSIRAKEKEYGGE